MAKERKGVQSNSVFGRRLKEARLRAKLSQQKLGVMAEIDVGASSARINRYEQGVHKPDYRIAEKIAAALQVPTPYLFTSDDSLAGLILDAAALSEKHMNQVRTYARSLKRSKS